MTLNKDLRWCVALESGVDFKKVTHRMRCTSCGIQFVLVPKPFHEALSDFLTTSSQLLIKLRPTSLFVPSNPRYFMELVGGQWLPGFHWSRTYVRAPRDRFTLHVDNVRG